MKRAHLLLLTVLLLVIAGALTSCGLFLSSAPEAGSRSARRAEEPVTITYYDWTDEQAYMTQVLSAFEKKYPTIKVNSFFLPTSDYVQKILVNLSTGEEMDVFATQSTSNLAEYISEDVLAPLDDMANSDTLAGNRDAIEQLRYNGHIYGFPYRTSKWVLYYNKDLFNKAKIPYPDVTWTWDQYEQAAIKLTGGSGPDKVYGSINYPSNNTWWRIPATVEGANNPLEPEHLKLFKKALAFYYRLTYTDRAAQPFNELVGNAQSDYTTALLTGKGAMMWNGDWEIQMLNEEIEKKGIKLNYGIAPLPHWKGSQPATTGSFAVVMVNKQSAHMNEAKRLAAFIGSEEAATIIAGNGLLTPWGTEAVNREYLKKMKLPEHADVFFQPIKVVSQVPMDPLYNQGIKIVEEETSDYLLQKRDLDKTFEIIQDRIRKEITTTSAEINRKG